MLSLATACGILKFLLVIGVSSEDETLRLMLDRAIFA